MAHSKSATDLRSRLAEMVAGTRDRNLGSLGGSAPISFGPVGDQDYTGVGSALNFGKIPLSGVARPVPGAPFIPSGSADSKDQNSEMNYKLLLEIANRSGIPYTNMGTLVKKNVAGTNRPSLHSFGNAVDFGGSPENVAKMAKFFTQFAPSLREIINTPTNTFLGRGGRTFTPRDITRQMHEKHVHVSADNRQALLAILAKLRGGK